MMTPIDNLFGEFKFEVKEALKKMKVGRALGPDNIPIERCHGDVAIV